LSALRAKAAGRLKEAAAPVPSTEAELPLVPATVVTTQSLAPEMDLVPELLAEGVAEGEVDAVEGCIEQSVAPGLSHVLPLVLFMKRPLLKNRSGDSAVA
jgi:hypothetical protein